MKSFEYFRCLRQEMICNCVEYALQWIVFWASPQYWNVFDPETSWNESDPLTDPAKGQQVSSGS